MGLKIVKSYYILALFALKKKSKIKNDEKGTCLIMSCICELLLNDIVSLDVNRKIIIKRELPKKYEHIKSLYEDIKNRKPRTMKKIVLNYMIVAFHAKKIKTLSNEILDSLKKENLVKIVQPSTSSREKYIIKEDEINILIGKLKEGIKRGETLTIEEILLLILLRESHIQKYYFDKKECQIIEKITKNVENQKMEGHMKEAIQLVNDLQDIIMLTVVATVSASLTS